MVNRMSAALFGAAFLSLQVVPDPAIADNQMGYRLLTTDQAAALPRGGGKLGLSVGRAQQINSGGMTFELLKVNGVSQGSPAGEAGLRTGDQIIAVDGRVFSTVATFASYIGSVQPNGRISIDYMPAGSGPQQAQRVGVTLEGSTSAPGAPAPSSRTGLSTGEKVAIGVGAAALFGCYKLGCFSHRPKPAMQAQPLPQ